MLPQTDISTLESPFWQAANILTKSPTHPHGIKVRLQSGQVGRVKWIIGE